MVYPAVNSFTAFEPGTVAPPLTKMNNFVSYDSDYSPPPRYVEQQPDSLHASQRLMDSFMSTESKVQSAQQNSLFHSPQSSLSSHDDHHHPHTVGISVGIHSYATTPSRKRPREDEDRKSLFMASVTLRPEHYRAVTPSESPTAFSYPAVPLTFAERKRLSDTLFHFSRVMICVLKCHRRFHHVVPSLSLNGDLPFCLFAFFSPRFIDRSRVYGDHLCCHWHALVLGSEGGR